jgi:hypothetical protein
VLHWEYWWWSIPILLLIIVFGYPWLFLCAAWVNDAPRPRKGWPRLGVLATIDLAMGLVFGVGFGWF